MKTEAAHAITVLEGKENSFSIFRGINVVKVIDCERKHVRCQKPRPSNEGDTQIGR